MEVQNQLVVGMSEIQVASGPTRYTCLGLGSCIGLCALDPFSGVSGAIHVMLPEAFPNRPVDRPGKFADTGLPELLHLMELAGAIRSKIIAAYAGGASVFQYGTGVPGVQDVGHRNAEAVRKVARELGINVIAHDTGGSNGRTIYMQSDTGEMVVKTISAGERVLCSLRRP